MPHTERALNPFPGPVPFTDKEAPFFFGREPETRELVSLLFARRAIFLYAQSGVGKTSLLHASLIPLLKKSRFDVLPVVRIGAPLPPDLAASPPQANPYILNTLFALGGEDADCPIAPSATIAESIACTKPAPEAEKTRLLIFDQFEEFFTCFPDRWQERVPFFTALGEALESDTALRVLIVLREEFLASLDNFEDHLLAGPAVRYRLERLGSEAAVEAVELPMQRAGRSFAPGVAELLVDKLLAIRVRQDSGVVHEALGEYVEPVQLQVVCRSLWDELPETSTTITGQDLQQFGDVNEALGDFYEAAVRGVVEQGLATEEELRLWFERVLITPALTRSTVFRGEFTTGGLPNKAVNSLDSPHHVVHAEERAGALWYELTHDRLIEPVLQSNQRWRALLSRGEQFRFTLEERALAWKNAKRDPSLLLSASEIAEANALLGDRSASGINDTTRSYIMGSHEKLNYEQSKLETERADFEASMARRFRKLTYAFAAACLVAFVALGVAVHLYRRVAESYGKERVSLNQALASRQVADRKTDEATILNGNLQKALGLLSTRDAQLTIEQGALLKKGGQLQQNEARLKQLNTELAGEKKEATDRAEEKSQTAETAKADRAVAVADDLSRQSGAFATTPDIRLQVVMHAAMLSMRSGSKMSVGPLDYLNQALQGAGPELQLAAHTPSVSAAAKDDDVRVMSVAYSPDGSLLATAAINGQVVLWNPHTGREAFSLPKQHTAGIRSVAFSPDGKQLVTGSEDKTAIVWDLAARSPIRTLRGHTEAVSVVAFSPDGNSIATGSYDGTLRVWPLSGEDARILKGHADAVYSLAWSPDGLLLASGSADGTIKLWSSKTGKAVASFAAHDEGVVTVSFSPNGNWLASGGGDYSAKLWHFTAKAAEPNLEHTLQGHENEVWSVSFTPDSQVLATSSEDGTICLWSVASGGLVHTLEAHAHGVRALDFSPDGSHLASAGYDGKATIWSLNGGADTLQSTAHQGPVYAVAVSPAGKGFVSGGRDGTKEWNTGETSTTVADSTAANGGTVTGIAYDRTGKTYATVTISGTVTIYPSGSLPRRLSSRPLSVVAYAPNGAMIALGDDTGAISLHAPTGRRMQTLTPHLGKLLRLQFSADGSHLGCISKDGAIAVWDTGKWQQSRVTALGELGTESRSGPQSATFNPDLTRILAIAHGGEVFLWNVATEQVIDPQPSSKRGKSERHLLRTAAASDSKGDNLSVSFSPDGERYAISSTTGEIRVVETSTGIVLRRLSRQTDWVREAAFSPDGTLLASVSDDHSVILWNLATGAGQELKGHTGWVISVSFAPDGRSLATSSLDRTVRVWDVASGAQTQQFEAKGIVMQTAFGPDSHHLATAGLDGRADLLVAAPGKAQVTKAVILQNSPYGGLKCVAFSPDGAELALGSMDNTAKIIDANTGELFHTLSGHDNYVNAVAFTADGSHLLTGSGDNTARLWDIASETQVRVFDAHKEPVTALVTAPFGNLFVTASHDGRAIVWNSETGAPVKTLAKHRKGINALAMSPDGKWLATGSSDLTVKVWNTATWTPVLTLTGFNDHSVKALSFTADSRHLVTADAGGTVKVFLLDEAQLFQTARDRVSAPLTDEQCSLYLDLAACPSDVSAFGKVAESNALSKAGDTAAAEARYREALLQEPGLGAHLALLAGNTAAPIGSPAPDAARASFTMAMRLVRGGRVHEGVLALDDAKRLDASMRPNASELNSFCWSGALWGQASEVIELCRQAVEEDPDNASIRDSKALAEAELGQLDQAATDFLPFALLDGKDSEQRRAWIQKLHGGISPFTTDLLTKLRTNNYFALGDD